MTERGNSKSTERHVDDTTQSARHRAATPLHDASAERFGAATAYTGRHRAPDAGRR